MTDRRTLLTGGANPAQATDPAAGTQAAAMVMAANRDAIPDVTVMTHEGAVAKFYSELVSDQVVMINFMSIGREAAFPITAKMAAIAKALGPQLGTKVQLISITTDPDNDTYDKLAAFHRQFGGYNGWTFVTTPSASAAMLSHRFYRHGRDLKLGGRMDIVQYGNDRFGLWAAFPWDIQVRDAVDRVNWVMPRDVATGEMRRAGPRPLESEGQRWNNRIA